MPDEVLDPPESTTEETTDTDTGGVVVEIEPERGAKPIPDEELNKLAGVGDDEIKLANESAKKAVRSLRQAYHEQRRRAEQWSKDASTASNLAEQLYRENQQLKQNVTRSESALIDQAHSRAEAQLLNAKEKHKKALEVNDADLIVAAGEDVARAVAEVDRLKILKPAAAQADKDATEAAAQPMPQQAKPPSDRTRAWVAANSWFGKDQEMTDFAMRQHHHLALDGVSEESNPELYWRTIEAKLKETYPEKFQATDKGARPTDGRSPRPMAVVGGQRSSNGSPSPSANGKRVVHLTESQIRIASRLGVTPEQYAVQLVKEQQDEERELQRRRVQ
jgi:hypothetical protein